MAYFARGGWVARWKVAGNNGKRYKYNFKTKEDAESFEFVMNEAERRREKQKLIKNFSYIEIEDKNRRKKQLFLKEFPCPNCGSIHTYAQKLEWGRYLILSCFECESKINISILIPFVQAIQNIVKIIKKKHGSLRAYNERLVSTEIKNNDTIRCMFCFHEVSDFKISGKIHHQKYYWRCKECFSSGVIKKKMLYHWKSLNNYLKLEYYKRKNKKIEKVKGKVI